MSNTIRKFIQDDIWNLGRNESWFSDMAKKGLHLSRVGLFFATFEKAEPKKTKYRMDIISPAPTEEQLEIYKESGWQLVTNLKELYIFSSPEEANYSELHTDPMEQSYTLAALNRRLRNQVIAFSVCMVLFFGLMISMFFLVRTPIHAMTQQWGIQFPLLMFVELYVFYVVIRNYISLRGLRKSLSEGKPLNHREGWRKPRLINGVISIFFLFIALLIAFIPLTGIISSRTYTLPETADNLPVIRLADIERNPELEREVRYVIRGVEWGNQVSYEWSPLAPVQYKINERGIVKSMKWDDGSGSYSPSIETYYYRLTFPFMADGLKHDLMKRYVELSDPNIVVQEVDNALLGKLFVAEDGIRKQIFACSGNQVIYISYFGNAQAEDIITLLPKVFMKQ